MAALGEVMISGKTVLLVGAGGSQPYGFPLGTELRTKLLASLARPTLTGFTTLVNCGFREDQIHQFRRELHDALHDTIDDFLSDRPTHRDIGTHAIAAELMSCEDHNHVFPKRDWYPLLLQLLDFKSGNQLLDGIITLNYDRSLEHFLTQTITVSYEGQTRENALRRLRDFAIVHVHGKLGDYPLRPYHKKAHVEEVKAAARDLRLTSDDDLDHSALYEKAATLCSEAKYVVCLGFGYHARVMKRLGLYAGTNQVLGTAFRLPEKRRKELQHGLGHRISLNKEGWQIGTYCQNILLA